MANQDIDELLQPSLADEVEHRRCYEPAPWTTSSLVFPAFFGGTIAVGLVAYWQAGRLYASAGTRRAIVWATLGATVLVLGIIAGILGTADDDLQRYVRWINRGIALLLFVGLERLLRPDERRAELIGVERASLWGPGFAAVLISTAVFFVAVMGLALFF